MFTLIILSNFKELTFPDRGGKQRTEYFHAKSHDVKQCDWLLSKAVQMCRRRKRHALLYVQLVGLLPKSRGKDAVFCDWARLSKQGEKILKE